MIDFITITRAIYNNASLVKQRIEEYLIEYHIHMLACIEIILVFPTQIQNPVSWSTGDFEKRACVMRIRAIGKYEM